MEDFNNYENKEVETDTNFSSGYTHEEKLWAMLTHLSALVGLIVPFGNIIGPLLIWILKKEESRFINQQGKESLNFQISITIYAIIAIILTLLLVGVFLLLIVGVFAVIMVIIASINAYDGKDYRYPLTIRFVK